MVDEPHAIKAGAVSESFLSVDAMKSAQTAILHWYDTNRRDLPWRAKPGTKPDPYRVWLSEIMLQQTTVATVSNRYARFLERWPTVADLAAASLDEVLHEWQGLGYYARARNLHRCAKAVAGEGAGKFPERAHALRQLPGIGEYTSRAIAAIVFGERAAPVDANVERVIARIAGIEQPLPAAKTAIQASAEQLEPPARPGDWAQALMDLGSAVCTARSPKCLICPASNVCKAKASGNPESFPVKQKKKQRPVRTGIVYWLTGSDGEVLLRKRPEKGMLGAMWEFPSAGWSTKTASPDAPSILALSNHWISQNEPIEHGFTHFEVRLTILHAQWNGSAIPAGSLWAHPEEFENFALPTLMKKVARRQRVPL